jgi:carbamoyltransferase
MEMGPRALGHRSILADPRTSASRARINRAVKHREAWRPFAPALTAGAASEYLVSPTPAQFMIKSFRVREEKRAEIPAVLHPADGTARPQLVERARTPTFHALLKAFEAETGVPVLLNTSFNDHGEPIVNTPTEAIKDFYGTGLDALVLGDRVLTK